MRRILLSLACLCVAFAVSNAHGKVGADDAFVIWSFNEGSGDTTKDLSDNKNDGKLTAGPKWVDGKFEKGVELAAKANVQSPTSTGVSKTFMSECLWVKFKDFGTENQFGYINATGQASTRFFYFSTWCAAGPPHNCIHLGTVDLKGGWGRGIVTPATFDADKWYYVCGVVDAANGKISAYVDGVEKISQDFDKGDSPGSPNQIWVGSSPEGYTSLNGAADDVGFFNVALTTDDMKTLMSKGLAGALLGGATAVDPTDKVATTWASVKRR